MRNAGLPIEVMIAYVNLFQQGDTTKNKARFPFGKRAYCDQTYKPSSVVNSHLSWPGVATTAHATFSKRAGQALSCFSAVLLRIGFT